jgi:ABC-type uncharacterized transport system permease subunit
MIFPISERLLFFVLSTFLYSVAFLMGILPLLQNRTYPRFVIRVFIFVGFLFQSLGMYLRGIEHQSCPIGNAFEVVQFMVWSLILLYALVGPSFRLSLLGFFTSGLATVLSIVSLMMPRWDGPVTAMSKTDPLLQGHASLALFCYGGFALLGVTSLMYLIQHHGLRHKWFQFFFSRLPALVELEKMNLRLLSICTLGYTLSMSLGLIYSLRNWDPVTASKFIMTGLLWVGFIVVYVMRRRRRLLGRRLAWTCIGLFLWALIALIPVERNRHLNQESVKLHDAP